MRVVERLGAVDVDADDRYVFLRLCRHVADENADRKILG